MSALQTLLASLPLDKDKLYARATLYRLGLSAEQVAAAVGEGLLCHRHQFGIEEFHIDGKPEWRATRHSRPRRDTKALPVPVVNVAGPTAAQKRPATAKKQGRPVEVSPLGF